MRNLKAYIWTGLVLVLAIGLVVSMFAPHGADLERQPGSAIDDAKVLCVRVYKAMDGGDIGIFAVNTEAEFTNMTLRIPGA